MKSVLIALAVIAAVNGADDLDPALCSTTGLVCTSCSQLATCILNEDIFDIVHLDYCNGANEKCSPSGCTTDRVAECDYAHLEFRCNNIGMFPDAFNCRKYHFCVPSGEGIIRYSATCDRGYGYNPTRTYCSDKLTNNVCELPVPLCNVPGETGPLSNPTLYYICAAYSLEDDTLYPRMFACPHGSTYDGFVCTAAVKNNVEAILAGKL